MNHSSVRNLQQREEEEETTPLLPVEEETARQGGEMAESRAGLRPIASQDPVASDGIIRPKEPFYRRMLDPNKMTGLERGLAIFAVLFLILWLVFLGLFISAKSMLGQLAARRPPASQLTSEGICVSPDCTTAGYEMLSLMNSSADPCNDFAQYACGGWLHSNDIPAEESSFGIFSQISKSNSKVLHRLLEDNSTIARVDEDGKKILTKVYDYYTSCMDIKAIEALGVAPLQKLAAEAVRIWPNSVGEDVNIAVERRKHFTEIVTFASTNGVSAFFQLYVGKDAKLDMNTVNVGQKGSSGTYLPSKERFKDAKTVETYTNTLAALFAAAPITQEVDAAEAKKMATEAVSFEKKLSEIALNPADLRDPAKNYNNMSLADFGKILTTFDLPTFIKAYTEKAVPEPIIVENKAWLAAFNQVISAASDQEIQSYFLGQLYLQKVSLLGDDTYRLIMPLRALLNGVDPNKLPERWEKCVAAVDGTLGFALGRLFIDEAFPGDSKKVAEDVVNAIRQGFKDRLPSLDWLDQETAKKAIAKLDNLHLKMGYPDKTPDTRSFKSLQEYYADLSVSTSTYFANSIGASAFYAKRAIVKTVGLPPDPNAFLMTPPTVNAYFSAEDNDIAFPAGILQRTLFHYTYPEYLNFASMGAVVGHEITHAFDDSGSQYDQNGRLNNWWPDEVRTRFTEKTQCFVHQYGNYSIGKYNGQDKFVNGQLTLGENLADNGGLKQAYTAWKKRFEAEAKDHPANVLLPGFQGVTRDQLFFIKFGQTWCTKSRPEYLLNQVERDPHSPAMIRVLGALSNNQEFAETFKCAAGATYAPKEKCDLW